MTSSAEAKPKSAYHFENASEFSAEYEKLGAQLKTDFLAAVVNSYIEHLNRVRDLGETPIFLVFYAGLFATIVQASDHEARQAGHSPPLLQSSSQTRQRAKFKEWRDHFLTDEQMLSVIRGDGASNLANLIGESEGSIKPGIEATLAAMVGDAWSSFEILIGDMWIAAVNICPCILADNVASTGKQIQLDKLKDYGYDISSKVGQVLVETNRVDFQSLSSIQEAYRIAFKKKAIDDVFREGPLLRAVEQLRHCLAHRRGVADRRSIASIQKSLAWKTAKKVKDSSSPGPS